jgi:uncharacterized paraquat-inducible protein A
MLLYLKLHLFNTSLPKQLAIIIAFFSGGWPYVKVACTFCCFILPPDLLSISRRETALKAMDVLGKWSLVDYFVMVLFYCAFHFQIQPQSGNAGVFVTVESMWGLYGYMFSILVTLGEILTFGN